jgi:hypothetical protein
MKSFLRSVYRAKYFGVAVLLCLAFSAVPASTQETTTPEVTVIHAGKLFDAHAGKMLDNQDILIRGEKIEKVGPSLAVPAGDAGLPQCAHAPDLEGRGRRL